MTKPKHQPCRCGCGELSDECRTGRNPLGAFTITRGIGSRDERPCRGQNTNICVAEGCYGEACRRQS